MAKRKPPPEVSAYMREIGKKGGKAKLKTLTAEQRSAIARKAGKAGGRGRAKRTDKP